MSIGTLTKGLLAVLFACIAVIWVRDGLAPPSGTDVTLADSSAIAEGRDMVILQRDASQHFWADAEVQGETIRFLVDTGATLVVLTPRDADRLGLDLVDDDFTMTAETGNGRVRLAPVTLDEIELGGIHLRNVQAAVSEHPLPHSLLGMSFLDRLSSYRVENNRLYLNP